MSADAKRADAAIANGDCPPVGATADEKGAYVFARYSVQNDHYVGFYQTWSKAVLFLLGKHWLKWLDGQRRYTTDTDVPPWRQQPVTNVVYAVYRTLAAKLTKQRPTLEVVPPSGDSEDREAARLGQALLVHLWRHLKMPAAMRRGIGWFLCTGQVYLRVHWDPEKGKRVPLTVPVEMPHPEQPDETVDVDCPCDANGKPYTTPDGAYDLEREPTTVPEGEVAFSIESPLSVRFNPDALDADDATEMFVTRPMPRARAAKLFDIAEEALEVASNDDRTEYDDLISAAAAGAGWLSDSTRTGTALGANQQDALGARSLVIEYFRRPDDERPEGAHWITIGRTKVWPKGADEAPLPNGFWPPLIPVLDLPIPGQPHAMGVLPQIVPLNERLNAHDGKIMEHHVTMSMGGKWITSPEDKGLQITSDPAQVMSSKGYANNKPPIQSKIEPLPADVYAERAEILDRIRMIGSLSEAELGTKPEGVSAGRAFLVLQEVTDSSLGPALQAWEEALEEVGRRQLVLAQQHYREERSIQIRGSRGQWEIRSFKGADLRDGLDVRVQQGSAFPWSKTAQQDVKLNILTSFPGLVTEPDGTVNEQKLAQFLETGNSGLDSFGHDENEDLVEVDREIGMFEAYDPDRGVTALPELALWQNQPRRLDAFFRFMKRDRSRFDRWHPDAQEAFKAHLHATVAAVAELAGMAAAATGGAPPAPGAVEGEAASEEDAALGGAPASLAAPGGAPNPNNDATLADADYASAEPAMAGA